MRGEESGEGQKKCKREKKLQEKRRDKSTDYNAGRARRDRISLVNKSH